MVGEEYPHSVDNTRPDLHNQDSQYQETHGSAQEDREKEVADAHLGDCGAKSENLEWRWRRKHGREHQAPERVSLKSGMQLLKTLRRNALAKQLFAAFVSDSVNDQAAQRRSRSRHQDIQQKTRVVLRNIATHHHIQWKAHGSAVKCRNGEHTPGSQGLQNGPKECGVFRQDVLDRLHYSEINSPKRHPCGIESLRH